MPTAEEYRVLPVEALSSRRAEVLVLLRSLSLAEWQRGGIHLSRGRLPLAHWVAALAAHEITTLLSSTARSRGRA